MYINPIIIVCVICLQFPYFHQLWKNICHRTWSGLPMPTSLYHLFLLMTSKQLAICMISIHILCLHHFWHMTVNSSTFHSHNLPYICYLLSFCQLLHLNRESHNYISWCFTGDSHCIFHRHVCFFTVHPVHWHSQNQILMLLALLIITKFVCGLMLNCTFNIKYLHL